MSDFPQTRQSLLIELGKHSDDAWAEFLVVYENAIYRVCRARGLQDADARDVTQEVLAAVHRRIPSWDLDASKGSFRAWLFRVARNISIDAIGERARRRMATDDSFVERALAQLPDDHGAETLEFDTEYRRSLFEWAAQEVKSEVRDVTWRSFQMTAIEGRKPDEVAGELGVPVGSVYTAKCRVVARIRSKVSHLGEDDALDPEQEWVR